MVMRYYSDFNLQEFEAITSDVNSEFQTQKQLSPLETEMICKLQELVHPQEQLTLYGYSVKGPSMYEIQCALAQETNIQVCRRCRGVLNTARPKATGTLIIDLEYGYLGTRC